MLDQTVLRERFEGLLAQARQAEGVYASLASQVHDPQLREQVEQIHRDKRRHILLTERLLEIVD